MKFKSKLITLPLYFSLLSVLFSPALTTAKTYGTGDIAAKRAAEQREAIAKRAEKRKKEKEAQKQAEAQKPVPAEEQKPVEASKEESPAQ